MIVLVKSLAFNEVLLAVIGTWKTRKISNSRNMMSYSSKTCQSDGLDSGKHGGMSYLTMGPRKGPGPGRFMNLDLCVAYTFEARGRHILALSVPWQHVFHCRERCESTGVSHFYESPSNCRYKPAKEAFWANLVILEKCRQGRPGNLEVRCLDLKNYQTGWFHMGLTQEVTPDSGYFRVIPRYGAGTWMHEWATFFLSLNFTVFCPKTGYK